MPIQVSSGRKNATPVIAPSRAPCHGLAPAVAIASSATPTGAKNHRLIDGNESHNASPATNANRTLRSMPPA